MRAAASRASLQGPRGFSLALSSTASGGAFTLESWANAGSLKNGMVEPAVIMAAIRPKLRRVNPRFTRSFFRSSLSMFIGPSLALMAGRLAGSRGSVQQKIFIKVIKLPFGAGLRVDKPHFRG